MATNVLVANPSKTSMVILNHKSKPGEEIHIKFGDAIIKQEKSAKLLGLVFDENQGWKTQIYGKGGLLSQLNKRLFAIRRLKNHINNVSLMKVIDGLFTSKLRYGLQLFSKVRRSDLDPMNGEMDDIQLIQNKLLRLICGTKLVDRVPTRELLNRANMLSVNQINAQIKIQEIWKALNIDNYPLKVQKHTVNSDTVNTRACTFGKLIESGKSLVSQKCCINDATKLWNNLPSDLKNCLSISQIKLQTKKFVKTLPV